MAVTFLTGWNVQTAQNCTKVKNQESARSSGEWASARRGQEQWREGTQAQRTMGGTGRETREVSTLQMKAVATARTHPPAQADPRPHSHSTREAVRQPQLAAPSRKTGMSLRLTLAWGPHPQKPFLRPHSPPGHHHPYPSPTALRVRRWLCHPYQHFPNNCTVHPVLVSSQSTQTNARMLFRG